MSLMSLCPFFENMYHLLVKGAGFALLGGAVGVALAHRVDGTAAHENVHILKFMAELPADGVHHLDSLPHHLGADSVAPDEGNFIIHRSILLFF